MEAALAALVLFGVGIPIMAVMAFVLMSMPDTDVEDL